MENKDDLISRRAVLDVIAKDIGMNETYDMVESLPGQMTAAETWEIAKEIVCNQSEESLQWVFNTADRELVLLANSPEEAKAKIEAWENRLKVGDVVEYVGAEGKAVVTKLYSDSEQCEAMTAVGNTGTYIIDTLRKTGKTIDIQSLLDQLGE